MRNGAARGRLLWLILHCAILIRASGSTAGCWAGRFVGLICLHNTTTQTSWPFTGPLSLSLALSVSRIEELHHTQRRTALIHDVMSSGAAR